MIGHSSPKGMEITNKTSQITFGTNHLSAGWHLCSQSVWRPYSFTKIDVYTVLILIHHLVELLLWATGPAEVGTDSARIIFLFVCFSSIPFSDKAYLNIRDLVFTCRLLQFGFCPGLKLSEATDNINTPQNRHNLSQNLIHHIPLLWSN